MSDVELALGKQIYFWLNTLIKDKLLALQFPDPVCPRCSSTCQQVRIYFLQKSSLGPSF